MAEYITKEEALNAVEDAMELTSSEYDMIAEKINNVPAVDVAPVKHGRWIEEESEIIICSGCNKGYNLVPRFTHYYPNCGAKMDGGKDE